MFADEMDRLMTLAEIAIAMAGFSSIVVLFKRRDSGTWLAADADRFNGMIVHSVAAAGLCLLPAVLSVFTDDAGLVWRLASAAMGVQVLLHASVVAFHLTHTGRGPALAVCAGGLGVVALQALNVLGIVFDADPGPFRIGVIWHLLHAGFLFSLLVVVGNASIER
jgi:hypothetical protein